MVRIVKRVLHGDLHRHPIKKSLSLETPNGHIHHFSSRPNLKHRFKRFLKRVGVLTVVLAAATICHATSPVVPKLDGPTAQVRGAGARVGEDLAVRCVNAAGTAFESCAGSGGAASAIGSYTVTPGTGSFNQGTYTVTAGTGTFQTQVSAALPAGTAVIGKVGIDQTTPGTTNGVQVNAALPAGTNNVGTVNGSTVSIVGANGAPPIVAVASGAAVGISQIYGVDLSTGPDGDHPVPVRNLRLEKLEEQVQIQLAEIANLLRSLLNAAGRGYESAMPESR